MNLHSRLLLTLLPFLSPLLVAQDPTPPKGPDKEVAEKLKELKEIVADKKFARDDEGVKLIDELRKKREEGMHEKDVAATVKGLEGVLNQGKLRPPDARGIYDATAEVLAFFGPDGAKVLRAAYDGKRIPDKHEWVSLRERFLKCVGKTKDESMVKFLIDEARRAHEALLQAAAGEALGNFEESKEPIRKQIVGELLIKYGELDELASQLGSANIEAQNARDRLAVLSDRWNTTLSRLTKQNFRTLREWQAWYQKNKNAAW